MIQKDNTLLLTPAEKNFLCYSDGQSLASLVSYKGEFVVLIRRGSTWPGTYRGQKERIIELLQNGADLEPFPRTGKVMLHNPDKVPDGLD